MSIEHLRAQADRLKDASQLADAAANLEASLRQMKAAQQDTSWTPESRQSLVETILHAIMPCMPNDAKTCQHLVCVLNELLTADSQPNLRAHPALVALALDALLLLPPGSAEKHPSTSYLAGLMQHGGGALPALLDEATSREAIWRMLRCREVVKLVSGVMLLRCVELVTTTFPFIGMRQFVFDSVPFVCSVWFAGTGPMRLMASPRTVKILKSEI